MDESSFLLNFRYIKLTKLLIFLKGVLRSCEVAYAKLFNARFRFSNSLFFDSTSLQQCIC